jgi:hypothetical protein
VNRAVGPYTTREASFAECLTYSAKQRKHSANLLPSVALGKEEMAKSLPRAGLGTQQSLCRVPDKKHSAKSLPSAGGVTLGKEIYLLSAASEALGKGIIFF